MISKTTLSLILCVLGLSTWKYEKTNHAGEKINVDKMREKLNPSPMKEDDNEKINPAVDKTNVDKTKEDLNPSSMKDPLKQNLEEEGLFINFTGFMPLSALDATQCSPFLLLIYMCGADRVAAVSTVFVRMFSAEGLIELAVSLLPALYVTYKWKREKTELEKKNSELVKDSEKKEPDLTKTLTEVKTELENWRNKLRGILNDVEKKKKENKQKLQLVEKEITEREANFDKPEELLREKENLLRDQWNLDQIKKDTERQLLNIEKLMDPIEMQVTRIHRVDKENSQT